jgi:hypothetical protein
MKRLQRPLTFSAIDELGFAAATGKLDTGNLPARYVPTRLGPLLELLCLVAVGRLPSDIVRSWLVPNGARPMLTALQEDRERWASRDRRLGFIRTLRSGANADTFLTAFLMDAQRAAREVAELPGATPGQLAAAIEELENNIHEHSEAVDTGILAYRAVPGEFEFVAADRGIGILESLRQCPAFAALVDHGKALQSALAEGISRFGTHSGRGMGFRPIFIGLLDMYGSLRFRSGDHALIMDGTSPQLSTAQLAQKPVIDGFFASVLCQNGPTS